RPSLSAFALDSRNGRVDQLRRTRRSVVSALGTGRLLFRILIVSGNSFPPLRWVVSLRPRCNQPPTRKQISARLTRFDSYLKPIAASVSTERVLPLCASVVPTVSSVEGRDGKSFICARNHCPAQGR